MRGFYLFRNVPLKYNNFRNGAIMHDSHKLGEPKKIANK
jgi:hypothetical protein